MISSPARVSLARRAPLRRCACTAIGMLGAPYARVVPTILALAIHHSAVGLAARLERGHSVGNTCRNGGLCESDAFTSTLHEEMGC